MNCSAPQMVRGGAVKNGPHHTPPYFGARVALLTRHGKERVIAPTLADALAAEIEKAGGPAGLKHKEITALVAYLERLGTDIRAGAAGTPVAQVPATPVGAPRGGN